MTLILRNVQKAVHLDVQVFKNEINTLRELFQVHQYELSVICVENEYIQSLNRKYRGLDEPTDVLAFPFHKYDVPGKLPCLEDTNTELNQLGDIVLCLPYIADQCKQNNEKLCNTLPVMVTHGICHLIGYDHETQKQWREMYNTELNILTKFNHFTGKNCKPLLGVGH
ncbi:endoribonuclease YbeY [Patella vulgata]|uniref:endoribonuclease YbeY n=1 Tax=Patella vulgata TaxID=6465 RepID=UPI00217FB4F2|nr:endoribonuclease YbeY [Patella vulgata]